MVLLWKYLHFKKNQGFVLEDGFGCQKAPKLAHFGVLYGASGALRSIKLGLQNRAFLGQVCPKKKLQLVLKKS